MLENGVCLIKGIQEFDGGERGLRRYRNHSVFINYFPELFFLDHTIDHTYLEGHEYQGFQRKANLFFPQ